jgi:hypothetical protein
VDGIKDKSVNILKGCELKFKFDWSISYEMLINLYFMSIFSLKIFIFLEIRAAITLSMNQQPNSLISLMTNYFYNILLQIQKWIDQKMISQNKFHIKSKHSSKGISYLID